MGEIGEQSVFKCQMFSNRPKRSKHYETLNLSGKTLEHFWRVLDTRMAGQQKVLKPSLLDRPIGPACAVLFEIDIDRILFAATLHQPLLLPLSGAGRAVKGVTT